MPVGSDSDRKCADYAINLSAGASKHDIELFILLGEEAQLSARHESATKDYHKATIKLLRPCFVQARLTIKLSERVTLICPKIA